jgi:hypothetical protein
MIRHKFQGKLCHGLQLHTDYPGYNPAKFKPFRLVALLLRCVRELYPEFAVYRDFPYEYVLDKPAFDAINGGPRLRSWIEDPGQAPAALDRALLADERSWRAEAKKFYLY